MKDDPQITELLKRLKQARHRRLTKLSFEEKIEIVERLRELQTNRNLMRAHQTSRMKAEG
jgi:hypothetical protein